MVCVVYYALNGKLAWLLVRDKPVIVDAAKSMLRAWRLPLVCVIRRKKPEIPK
jgi:hypothetical protein